jgi:hypothetical protein
MQSQRRRIISAVFMFLVALALQRAATATWEEARATDGTRIRITPIGLAHVVAPSDPTIATVDCRWWPKIGSATLCAVRPDGAESYRRLRLAYPAIQVALWLAVVSIILQALRVPRQRWVHVAVSAGVFALVVSAIVLLRNMPAQTFVALDALPIDRTSLGSRLGWGAALLSFASTVLLIERSGVGAATALLLVLAPSTLIAQQRGASGASRIAPADSARGDSAAFATLPPRVRDVLDVRQRIHPSHPDPNLTCVPLSATSDGSRRQRLQGRVGDGTSLVVFARFTTTGSLRRVEFVRRLTGGVQRGFTWDAENDATIASEWPAGSTLASTYPVPKGGPIPRAVRALGRLVARWPCPPTDSAR